jgi:LysR family tcuABC transcriptional regulator
VIGEAPIKASACHNVNMELRQLRYFVAVVETGSMGRAARVLGVVTSALSQQIQRLEGELATVLLTRSARGVTPTEAGMAFARQAQLVLRHADEAVRAAQHARLSGQVSVGLTPTTAAVLALPLLRAMGERYPDVHLQLIESLSGNLVSQLNARQVDLAIVFQTGERGRWDSTPLLKERLFLMGHEDLLAGLPTTALSLKSLGDLPLVLPASRHGLRAVLNAAFERAGVRPNLIAEVDGLAVLMDMARAGLAATIQPGSALARASDPTIKAMAFTQPDMVRPSFIASLPEDELSPAALATRRVISETALALVQSEQWPGAH